MTDPGSKLSSSPVPARGLGIFACAALPLAWLLVGCVDQTAIQAKERANGLQAMHGACVTAMIKSTCQVVLDSARRDPASVVVIAGVGQVDAVAYAALRDAGDAMCSVAKAGCEKDWQGNACKSARALWSVAP
jgi:hypothetical protein